MDYSDVVDRPKLDRALDNSLAFCNGECFVILIQSFGTSSGISANGYSLGNKICSAEVFPTATAWENLMQTPPIPLIEPYYKCGYTWQNAFSTGIGIANGVALAAITFFSIVVFPLLVYLMEYFGFVHQHSTLGEEYNATDKAMALEELALQLLRVRDGDKRGITPGGELEKLAKDLVSIATSTANISRLETSEVGQDENYRSSFPQARLKPRLSASVFLDLNETNRYPGPSEAFDTGSSARAGGCAPTTRNPMNVKDGVSAQGEL